MEEFNLHEDIKVVCVTATSFPDGVKEAHEKLHTLIPFTTQRRYFGISWGGENELIHYKAAAEILNPKDATLSGTEPFIIRKGKYQSIVVKDYMKNVKLIGQAFDELLTLPELDPNGYCLEWYLSNNEVRCMVPLTNVPHHSISK